MFKQNTKTILIALVVILLIVVGVYALTNQNNNETNLSENEDNLVDENDDNNPSNDDGLPGGEGLSSEERAELTAYFENNISELSPEEAVLGGSFYVTNISFPEDGVAIVNYEDGHIALTAQADYKFNDEGPEITSFELTENNNFDENVDYEEGVSTGDEERTVVSYIENNLSDLSPKDPTLGGSFNVVSIDFPEQNMAIVDYEDGHDMLTAKADYVFDNGEVEINSFELIPEGSTIERNEDICEDLCGDGVCQEIVCMGEGCPCAETAQSCPADCS